MEKKGRISTQALSAILVGLFFSIGCGSNNTTTTTTNDYTSPPTDDPITLTGDVFKGGLVWDKWTSSDADGTGLPIGITSEYEDFIRCKSCHGWDTMGDAGGYVRRTSTSTRPEPTLGTDLTSDTAVLTLATVFHANGRLFTTLDNTMPAYNTIEGLSDQQAADVLEFLLKGPKIGDYATLDTAVDPVAYTFNDGVSISDGRDLYVTSCSACHTKNLSNPIPGKETSLLDYFKSDGKFSEGFHKSVYGIPGTDMTRSAMDDLNGTQAADIMAYIQNQITP